MGLKMQNLFRLLAAVAALCLPATAALGCACCHEYAQRDLHIMDTDGWLGEVLAGLQPTGSAKLFVRACDLACIRGLDNPQYEYPVSVTVSPNQWMFDMGAAGTIKVDLPDQATYFASDLDPLLVVEQRGMFKEYRFAVAATGTGDFAALQLDNGSAELILQGLGNSCTEAEYFRTWRLQVTGPDVEFTLFGELTVRQ